MHDRIEVRSSEESSSKVSAGTADPYSAIPASTQNRSKIFFGATKIGPKTTKKRENSTVGRSEALGDSPRTPGKASKSGSGRVRDGPKAFVAGPGGPKSGQDRFGNRPGSVRGPSRRRQDAAQERSEDKSVYEQPPDRNFVVCWSDRRKAEPQILSASAVFC